tara:strand:+ start:1215 stop:2483 length:1269 start_codon:yes stop_codon:yes gene_type:complete
MGSAKKVIKKVKKAIKKPVSKAFKGIAKGIMKVGKATMRGIASLNKKLGPLGSIALSIAMPYALGGLSSMIGHGGMAAGGASGMMGSKSLFIRSIGNVGNAIRTGYNAASLKISGIKNSITSSIKKSFSSFGKGNNIFSRISNGAKDLFVKSRDFLKQKMPKPFKGTQGTVQVSDYGNPFGFEQTGTMTSNQAASALKSGVVDASQLSNQTLGKQGWFTQGSTATDKIVTDNINNAYQSTIDNYSPSMKKYFNDKVAFEKAQGTYINNAMTGFDAESSLGTIKNYATDFSNTPYNIDVDLSKTGDYTMGTTAPGQATEYTFTGNKSYSNLNKKPLISDKIKSNIKKTAFSKLEGLLSPTTEIPDMMEVVGSQGDFSNTAKTTYGGTDIEGTAGGTFVEDVFGTRAANNMKTYYQNMNIHGSM